MRCDRCKNKEALYWIEYETISGKRHYDLCENCCESLDRWITK